MRQHPIRTCTAATLLAGAAFALFSCARGPAPSAPSAPASDARAGSAAAHDGPPAEGAGAAHVARLRALLEREWDYELEHTPTYASVIGDRRWNDRWEDLSLSAIDAIDRHDRAVLSELATIDRALLPAEEQIDYDLFTRDCVTWTKEHELALHLLPTSQMASLPEYVRALTGVQVAYQLAGTLRFETSKDYRDWTARMQRFPAYVDQTMALMREGVRRRLVHPRIVLQRIPAQLDPQLVDDPTKSGFYAPFKRFPAQVAAAEQQRLSADARAAIADGVVPALRRFRQFLVSEYIPAAPEQVGIWQMPNGPAMYTFLARKFTTTDRTPDALHELGLSEVRALRAKMEAVKEKAGFRGALPDFFRFLRTDPRFYDRTGDELLLRYRGVAKRIDPLLVKLFKTLPRQPYGVEPTPEAMAPDTPTGFYYPGAPDGSRAGTYLVNLYRPETRPRWEMIPLTLHEAVPGHHFQVSLAAEQGHVSKFRRYGYYVAFGEGWALYSETLGYELGLYEDPYDAFGQLAYETWRAVRLVVDTGLHAKKWTRQQAIDYFMENAPRQKLDVVNEVDRYIAMPGQALGYKVGQLAIRDLRSRAERALGDRFDVRAFHDVVLLAGSLPLDVLEQRVDAWIRERR
ncbi:DUF885 domain-containing protein [Pendulispora albinea]|uniref:DUF885 domain-containing protein n=1 Tax=Pendulispora albinea TaxID=2741071 RepID=A0ABZ2M2D9_9BACT